MSERSYHRATSRSRNDIKHKLFYNAKGGIAPNQVIARSEFEVHHCQIYTE